MINALLPLYLVTVLGASTFMVGVIEGIAEATASTVKIFSGAFSDRLGKRKPIVATGYGLSAVAKPLFPLAGSVGWIITARFFDRVGKGIRDAPRDALIADISPAETRGDIRSASVARHRRRVPWTSPCHHAHDVDREQLHLRVLGGGDSSGSFVCGDSARRR
jgi:MFS family permease